MRVILVVIFMLVDTIFDNKFLVTKNYLKKYIIISCLISYFQVINLCHTFCCTIVQYKPNLNFNVACVATPGFAGSSTNIDHKLHLQPFGPNKNSK